MAIKNHLELVKKGAETWNNWYSAHPEVIADLSAACLAGLDLSGYVLTGANLTAADLRSADLTGADLRGALLGQALLDGATLDRADLRFTTTLQSEALSQTSGNRETRLPQHVKRPSRWERPSAIPFRSLESLEALSPTGSAS